VLSSIEKLCNFLLVWNVPDVSKDTASKIRTLSQELQDPQKRMRVVKSDLLQSISTPGGVTWARWIKPASEQGQCTSNG
jgi:hypothetical protein